MTHHLVTLALAPILFIQGRQVRQNIPLLPEPIGERKGISGKGKPLKLLILGDSAAAGVGVAHQNDALLGQVVNHLASRFEVHWRLHAKTGATTASSINSLTKLAGDNFDVAIISLGVNDVTKQVGFRKWQQSQQALREKLHQQFGVKHIIFSGLPPVDKFPALPQPLRWYLGRRANQFNSSLKQLLANVDGASFLNLRMTTDLSAMADDGFHPGAQVYALWGKSAAEKIVKLFT